MKERFFLLLLILLTVALNGCKDTYEDQEQMLLQKKIVIKFSHVAEPDTPKGKAAQLFSKLVEERTGGRVEVQVFPDSTLYKDGEEIQMLLENSVQMINPSTSKLTKIDPRWQVFDLPYLFPDPQTARAVISGEFGRRFMETLDGHGLIGLGIWYGGFKNITNGIRPLINTEDFTGLSIRVMPDSKVLHDQLALVNARAVPLPYNEVYNSLLNGQLNGQENTPINIYTKRFHQIQKYMTVSNHGFLCHVVVVNKKFWYELPPDIRTILEATMVDVNKFEWDIAHQINEEALKIIRDSGEIIIHDQTLQEKEAWKKEMTSIYGKYWGMIGSELTQFLNIPTKGGGE